jgi:leucyl-tRNA synthetase
MEKYDHKAIESKWQKVWEEQKTFAADDFSKKEKWYTLVEFPYPSGAGLHVGHVRSYAALDTVSRKKRMDGYNVLYPIGWDAFGLPTENYAIKTKTHPVKATADNIATFKRQLQSIGLSYDWDREVNTTDPKYFKWTQWIFLQLLEKGLAYKHKMPINWCTSCKIGLANEEVVDGKCERCKGEVVKKEKEQWMLAITKYADRLIDDLETVDFLDKIKNQQINWIGKSNGAEISFQFENSDEKVDVFTTRPDTLWGATYFVLAPEHPLVQKMCSTGCKEKVKAYVKKCATESDLERQEAKTKTGEPLGVNIINPATGKPIPVWIADYVMMGYGTGAIMCVPAHDERDNEFAKKFDLPIVEVVGDIADPYQKTGGIIKNSDFINGLTVEDAVKKMIDWVEEKKIGKRQINFKLRDWVFSRQRYWGEPIPVVHCDKCGTVPLPESELPLELPEIEIYEPTDDGQSPLARIDAWVNCKCPKCKGDAKRETDTMPNWAGSSWYFLRYIDPNNDEAFASADKLKYWTPVNLYNGGMEHTTLHLLYSRFWHKFLFDCGFVPTSEPYAKRISHGMILAEDGRKMSKSFDNVINPDEIIQKHGADTLRLYEMFMGPFDQAIAWESGAVSGCRKFLDKVWNLFEKPFDELREDGTCETGMRTDVRQLTHRTVKKVTEDVDNFKFNTAISQLMIFMNEARKWEKLPKKTMEKFVKLLAPFAPHLAEEIWTEILGKKDTITYAPWPKFDPAFLEDDTVTYAIQVNGKLRGEIEMSKEVGKDEVLKQAKAIEKVAKYLAEGDVKKEIFVPGKIVGFVVS